MTVHRSTLAPAVALFLLACLAVLYDAIRPAVAPGDGKTTETK